MLEVATELLFIFHVVGDIVGFFLWISLVDQQKKEKWLILPLVFSFLGDMHFRLSYYQLAPGCYQYFFWASAALLWMKVVLLYTGWNARRYLQHRIIIQLGEES